LFSNREIIIKYAEAIHELFMRIEEKLVEGLGKKVKKMDLRIGHTNSR